MVNILQQQDMANVGAFATPIIARRAEQAGFNPLAAMYMGQGQVNPMALAAMTYPASAGTIETADSGDPRRGMFPTGSQTTTPGQRYRGAISSIESGSPQGNYRAVGPPTRNGARAYGRYQVMDFNIPNWTREVLGRAYTPQEFLADDRAQDAVFDAKFGQYVRRYGNPEDAAAAWFGGPGNVNNPSASDGNIDVAEYRRRFTAGLR